MVSIVMPARLRSRRHFYARTAFVMAVVTFVGFAPTYYLSGFNQNATPALTPLVHIHGALCTAWIALLVVQTKLIVLRKRHTHQLLGLAGLLLAGAVLATGVAVAIDSERRVHTAANADTLADPYVFLIFPLSAVTLFAVFVALGVLRRRDGDYHKRFMLLATASLVGPAIARIVTQVLGVPGALGALVLIDLFVVALAIHDWHVRKRLHPVTLWGGGFLVLSGPARVALAFTAGWQAFAQALMT